MDDDDPCDDGMGNHTRSLVDDIMPLSFVCELGHVVASNTQ